MKHKTCETCKSEVGVAFRIQVQKGKTWVFVCKTCLSEHQKGDFYRYGGTWKGYRH